MDFRTTSQRFRPDSTFAAGGCEALILIFVVAWAAVLPGEELQPLPPGRVRAGGEIGRRVELTVRENLLRLDIERDFLTPFRERRTERGGAYIGLGKLIDASVSFAAYTGSPEVLAFKDRLVAETIATQLEDGYIGLYRPGRRVFVYWDLHEMVYIVQGLTADYRMFGQARSLEAARKLADFILSRRRPQDRPRSVGKLNLERAFIALSEATGERKYLDYAVTGMDLRNWRQPPAGHAYTYMNICLAQLDLYRLERKEELLAQSRRLVEFLTAGDGLVVTGTCSLREGFHTDQEGRGDLGETCATAYLIRLLHHLMQLDPRPLYGDLMERAIYNALFAAQSPDGRRLRYFTAFEGPRVYYERDTYCCPNNFRRIVAELPRMIFYRSKSGVTVNLYTPSTANFELPGGETVELRQETDYPNSGTVILHVAPSAPVEFALRLRIPRWASGATVSVNGEAPEAAAPGTFFEVARPWRKEDVVRLEMPMRVRFAKGRKKQTGKVALLRGPVLFCLAPSRQETSESGLWSPGSPGAAERSKLESRIRELEARLGPLEGRPVDLADIVAGGSGFGDAPRGRGIDVRTGKPTAESAPFLDCEVNRFVPADSPFVDGVVIPDGGAGEAVPVSSTGLTVRGVPDTSGRTWDHLKSGPVRSQHTTIAGGVDYAGRGRSMLSIHANKVVTFDLDRIRAATGYGRLTFRAVLAYGGAPEPTVEVAVFAGGEPLLERTPLSRAEPREPREVSLPLEEDRRFLTILVTDGNGDISHDQVFLGDPKLVPDRERAPAGADRKLAAELRAELHGLERSLARFLTPEEIIERLTIDCGSVEGPFSDSRVRPDGLALKVKAWGPGSDPALPADLTLTLTEFADPEGRAVYFVPREPGAGVDDELAAGAGLRR